MFTGNQNLALVRTELDNVFFQTWNRPQGVSWASADTADLFKPINWNLSEYIFEIYKGSELADAIGETEIVPLTTAKIDYKKVVKVLDFAKGEEISKNLFDDGKFQVWTKTVEDMAMKARITQDDNAFKIFRGAFTTTLTADGVSLINASHPLIGGGTQSNLVTGALSPSTLNDAMVSLMQQKDQAGVVIGSSPSILLVPIALFKTALQITESQLESDSANNNINVYRSQMGVKVYTSPRIGSAAGGSDTAWFLMSQNHTIYRVIRQGIQTGLRDWKESNNRTYFYQYNFREEVFAGDHIGIVGALGA
jgi:hypothetical protein